MTRYLTLQIHREDTTGAIPAYINFVGATNVSEQFVPMLLDFEGFSLPVNNNTAGRIPIPDGATSFNIMLAKADGTWESQYGGSITDSSLTTSADLISSFSAYKVIEPNQKCLIWHVFDASEISKSLFSDGSNMYGYKSWAPSSFTGHRFENKGHHIFVTDGNGVQLVNTTAHATIPSLEGGHQINRYDVTTETHTINVTPANTITTDTFVDNGVTYTAHNTRSIKLSTNFRNLSVHGEATDYVPSNTSCVYGGSLSHELTLQHKPVLTVKSTNASFWATLGSQTTETGPFTVTCEVNATVTIRVHKVNDDRVVDVPVVMGSTDKEVDAANYGEYFPNIPPDNPDLGPSVTVVNQTAEDLTLVAVKDGNEYVLGSIAAGETSVITYDPSLYWKQGAWVGIAGFNFYIDFKLKGVSKESNFQIVALQSEWPSSYSYTVSSANFKEPEQTVKDMIKGGAVIVGLVLVIIVIIALAVRS